VRIELTPRARRITNESTTTSRITRVPLLFSYGTLQNAEVQLSTFGRRLDGQADELVGFEQSSLKIEDPEFVATSGQSHHAIVKCNGRSDSRVRGMVFDVSDAELASADRYEPAGYTRIATTLASGTQAWVYADARFVQARVTPSTPPR